MVLTEAVSPYENWTVNRTSCGKTRDLRVSGSIITNGGEAVATSHVANPKQLGSEPATFGDGHVPSCAAHQHGYRRRLIFAVVSRESWEKLDPSIGPMVNALKCLVSQCRL